MTADKKAQKRADLLETLADHVLRHGIAGSSLRPLAKSAGISDRMLLYYFEDKADLLGSTLTVIASRMHDRLVDHEGPPRPFDMLLADLAGLIAEEDLRPFMQVWLEMASLAARGDPVCRSTGAQIGQGFLVWIEGQLAPGADARAGDAARLLATLEGIALLGSFGLDEACNAIIAGQTA